MGLINIQNKKKEGFTLGDKAKTLAGGTSSGASYAKGIGGAFESATHLEMILIAAEAIAKQIIGGDS